MSGGSAVGFLDPAAPVWISRTNSRAPNPPVSMVPGTDLGLTPLVSMVPGTDLRLTKPASASSPHGLSWREEVLLISGTDRDTIPGKPAGSGTDRYPTVTDAACGTPRPVKPEYVIAGAVRWGVSRGPGTTSGLTPDPGGDFANGTVLREPDGFPG